MTQLLSTLGSSHTTRFVKRGTMLLYQSEIPRHAMVIKKGLVRAYVITSSGEERIITLHDDSDILPLSWVAGETRTTLFYYETLTDCEIITIPKDELMRTISRHPDVTKEMLRLTINRHTSLLLRITALEQSSAAEKIALTLYYLLLRHGKEVQPDTYAIQIKMTQSMIASLVGLTRESTAVNLKLLKKKGIVSYANFSYSVNKDQLERFVGEDSFKNVLEPTS